MKRLIQSSTFDLSNPDDALNQLKFTFDDIYTDLETIKRRMASSPVMEDHFWEIVERYRNELGATSRRIAKLMAR
jgi:hypothetical protein